MNNLVLSGQNRFADLELVPLEREIPQSTALEQLFAALYRQRYLIASCVGVCMLLGALVSLTATRTYTASASVQLDQQTPQVFGNNDLDPTPSVQDSDRFLQTQLDRLHSRSIAERVYEELGIGKSPATLKALGVEPADQATNEALGVAALQAGMDARLGLNTRLAQLSFTSFDPNVSARVANGFADALAESNIDAKQDTSNKAKQYLLEQLAPAKDRLETSEREMLAYARKADLTTTVVPTSGDNDRGGSLRSQQLGQMTDSLSQATTRRIDAQQRWAQVQGTAALSLPEVESNSAIQNLVAQKAQLQASLEENRQRYTDEYPAVKETAAKIKELDGQINNFASSIRSSFYGQYLAAAQQERQMQQSVASLKGAAMSERERSVGFNSLSREVETNKAFYDGLLQRYKEVATAAGATAANVTVLDHAWPPYLADSRNLARNLALGGMAGLMLAFMIGALRERMHFVVRTSDDLERRMNIPALGVVPKIAAPDDKPETVATQLLAQSEAYHSIAVALEDASSGTLPKTLLVTSSAASEGKSTSAIGIARSLSAMGKNVLLIDGDLRRPSAGKIAGDPPAPAVEMEEPSNRFVAFARRTFGKLSAFVRRAYGDPEIVSNRLASAPASATRGRRKAAKPGLSDVLKGSTAIEKTVQKSSSNEFNIVRAGDHNSNPVSLLAADKIKTVFQKLAAQHDIVIVDGPPVMGLADAVLLARSVDAVLVVTEANRTLLTQLNVALSRLPGSNIIGGIITKFDAKAAGVHYGDYNYYSYDERASADDVVPA